MSSNTGSYTDVTLSSKILTNQWYMQALPRTSTLRETGMLQRAGTVAGTLDDEKRGSRSGQLAGRRPGPAYGEVLQSGGSLRVVDWPGSDQGNLKSALPAGQRTMNMATGSDRGAVVSADLVLAYPAQPSQSQRAQVAYRENGRP